jgi:hypothetical protein
MGNLAVSTESLSAELLTAKSPRTPSLKQPESHPQIARIPQIADKGMWKAGTENLADFDRTIDGRIIRKRRAS